MANKYIRQGETYCGDGTTSAAATSNGGTGAWNNINVLEGTAPAYGSAPAAGDVIYIRSKTSAGADITRTLAGNATLGSSSATSTAPITWVLDGGTIWSGINGTLTYECPSTYFITLVNWNLYRAETREKFVVKETAADVGGKNLVTIPSSSFIEVDGWRVDCSLNTNIYGTSMYVGTNCDMTFRRCYIKVGHHYSAFISLQYTTCTFVGTDIEISYEETYSPLFLMNYISHLSIYGGRIFYSSAFSNASIFGGGGDAGPVMVVGTAISRDVKLIHSLPASGTFEVQLVGVDGGTGATIVRPPGYVDSRSDGNYPTLDTYIKSSPSTPWSWKLYPVNASVGNKIVLPSAMLFSDTAAVKTITAHVLVPTTNTSVNKASLCLDVSYVDNATGLPVFCSTLVPSGGALDSDTASWSAATYGPTSFNKKKLEITTPSAIKQNTMVMATLLCAAKSASATDIIFFDPAVGIA